MLSSVISLTTLGNPPDLISLFSLRDWPYTVAHARSYPPSSPFFPLPLLVRQFSHLPLLLATRSPSDVGLREGHLLKSLTESIPTFAEQLAAAGLGGGTKTSNGADQAPQQCQKTRHSLPSGSSGVASGDNDPPADHHTYCGSSRSFRRTGRKTRHKSSPASDDRRISTATDKPG